MKCSKRSFSVAALFAVHLSFSIGTLNARDSDLASRTFAEAAQTFKQQCIKTCNARYRGCVFKFKEQIPSPFACRRGYHDCTRYTCNGLPV
jgi:hypothetical protein